MDDAWDDVMDNDDNFSSLSREEKEDELMRLEDVERKYHEELMGGFKSAASKNPGVFVRMLCEYELEASTPFADDLSRIMRIFGDDKIHLYKDVARAMLTRLEKNNDIYDGREYVLLADYVASYITESFDHRVFDKEPRDIRRLPDHFFSSKERQFGEALWFACELVYHGLPIFFQQDDSTYQQLAFDDPDYVYLSKMGEYWIRDRTTDFPYWAKKYYVKADHLRAERLYFASDRLKPEDVPALRKSLRAHLGVEGAADNEKPSQLHVRLAGPEREIASSGASKTPGSPVQTTESFTGLSFPYETKGLRLVAAVQAKFLGQNYDPDNKDSYPSQDSVISWLESEHSIKSDVEKKAIDRVAMPFTRGRVSRP